MHFKVIGFGAVVRQFLKFAASDFPDILFSIYARNIDRDFFQQKNIDILPIEKFLADDLPTLVCCSADEKELLKQSEESKSRRTIASANIAIIRWLAERGVFAEGSYFILTNPSEIIGQFISENAKNSKVYSLGLSVDHVRYSDIILRRNSDKVCPIFDLAGNHWDRSFPVLCTGANYSRKVLDSIYEQYTDLVQKEFIGYKPPVQSGVDAISHVVKSFCALTPLPVSGRDPASGNFIAGTFYPQENLFSPTVPKDDVGKNLLREIIGRHEVLAKEFAT